ncbi:DEBR0S2_16072g1_1 [Brettanomyces bruxellensis]|uniref:DEBR0S2_16072g1_1 n=1 Tax=Dekkera bruxellensis TaxID=5007 RepID=A0A7D9CX44_DEKBR|nr:DEBR0S2_16072g1_1 [Brettanomyces bruxellensis]
MSPTNDQTMTNSINDVDSTLQTNVSRLEQIRIRCLSKSLKYKEFFRRSQKLPTEGFNHFFLSQELQPVDDSSAENFIDEISTYSDLDNSSQFARMNRGSSSESGTTTTDQNPRLNVSEAKCKVKENMTHKATFILKFSNDGKYMASAGDDGTINIWEVLSSSYERHKCAPCATFPTSIDRSINSNATHALPMTDGVSSMVPNSIPNVLTSNNRTASMANIHDDARNLNPYLSVRSSSPSALSLASLVRRSSVRRARSRSRSSYSSMNSLSPTIVHDDSSYHTKRKKSKGKNEAPAFAPIFKPRPVKRFKHSDTILSISWSKNNFLLTSSEDGTVKLWHIDQEECLRCLKLDSFATSVLFHEKDDRFFACSEWDGTIFFYSILEHQIVYETKLQHRITSMAFSPDMKYIFVGCDTGYFYILTLDGFKRVAKLQIQHKKNFPRITGIRTFELDGDTKILISTNDSRIRLFSFRSKSLEVKYSGLDNEYSMIEATTNEDHTFVVSGSEDGWAYLWKLYDSKDSIISRHSKSLKKLPMEIVSRFRDDSCQLKNKHYGAFHLHHTRCNAAIFAPRTTLKLLELGNDPIIDLKSKYGRFVSQLGHADKDDLSTAIIVTTDNKGIIRVLRRDSSYYVRKIINSKKGAFKKVLEKAVIYYQQDHHSLTLGPEYNSLPRPSHALSISDSSTSSVQSDVRGRYSSFEKSGGRGHAKSISATKSGTQELTNKDSKSHLENCSLSVVSSAARSADNSSTISLETTSHNSSTYSAGGAVYKHFDDTKENASSQNFKNIDEQIRQLIIDDDQDSNDAEVLSTSKKESSKHRTSEDRSGNDHRKKEDGPNASVSVLKEGHTMNNSVSTITNPPAIKVNSSTRVDEEDSIK